MVFDLIVLGGGPAGYLAAERAGHAGLKTLLIEKRNLGGVCLNEGCIPSKTLLYSAKLYDNARSSEKYGVISKDVSFNHKKVVQRKDKVIKTLVSGIKYQLKQNTVVVKDGFGKIVCKNFNGFEVDVNNEIFTGKNIIISTGSENIIPSIPSFKEGIERGNVITNKEILGLKEIPKSLVIIGGGVIGLEMASYFSSAGSKVTIIEMLDHIAGNMDKDISNILMKNFIDKGVDIKLKSKVVNINYDEVIYESEGKTSSLDADKVLLSIGRKPVIENIGLENVGVEVEKGKILTDKFCKTNIPGIYAAGDVNGKSMLAHTAYREAEVCVNNILGKKDIMRYNAIPSVIYTNPEIASVGETEETATQKNIDYKVSNISMKYSGRYLAENEKADGICKVLVDTKYNRLIGTQIIGSYASEIIFGAAIMIETEMRIKDIKELVFPHPTVSEIIREGIFKL